jgi:hypothetical protein
MTLGLRDLLNPGEPRGSRVTAALVVACLGCFVMGCTSTAASADSDDAGQAPDTKHVTAPDAARSAADARSESVRAPSDAESPDAEGPTDVDAGAHTADASGRDAARTDTILVGLNGTVGMGKGWSDFIISNGGGPRGSGLTWGRCGVTGPYVHGSTSIDTDDGSTDYGLAAGYGEVIILGDSACDMTLADAQSWMKAYASYGDRIVWEYCNEPWNGNGNALVPPGQLAMSYEAL